MAIGRIFPIQSPYRSFPFDPLVNGDTPRNAPLPFALGAGASATIETIYEVRPLLQISISAILDPNNPGGGTGGAALVCNPITNRFCTPTGTFTKANSPVATIRCAIT